MGLYFEEALIREAPTSLTEEHEVRHEIGKMDTKKINDA